MNDVSFTPSFQGKFLNPELVQSAAKKSQRQFINNNCKSGRAVLDKENIAVFQEKANKIIQFLNNLAAKLPDDMNLVLTKVPRSERYYNDYKSLSLDVSGPLGKTEFMGNVNRLRTYNIPKNCQSESYDLGCVEIAISPLKQPYESSTYFPISRNATDVEIADGITRSYINFIEKRLQSAIKARKTHNIYKKIDELVNFAKSAGYKRFVENIEFSLKNRLQEIENIKATKKANKMFRLKNFLGIS